MANGNGSTESTTVTTTPATPTRLGGLSTAAQPLSVLLLATGGALAIVIIAVGALFDRVDSQTVLSILSTFFGFLGGVMGGAAVGRSMAQRGTDVTTTTTGPSTSTTSPATPGGTGRG